MTSIERKSNTENLLRELGIPFIEHLPAIEEENEVRLRAPREIATRIICLTYLCYVTEVPEARTAVIEFLKKESLWSEVTDQEKELFNKTKLTQQERINISWRSEAIWLLLWAIEKTDELELPYNEINVADIIEKLPKVLNSTNDFIESATIRSTEQLLDQSDLIYRLHWATRHAQLDRTIKLKLNSSVVEERHYAINWITYYAEAWDDITTDT